MDRKIQVNIAIVLILLFTQSLWAMSDFDIADIHDAPGERGVEYPEWFTPSFLDLSEDLKEAKAQNKRGIIVYFGQKDCAYCEALMEVNFGREKNIVNYTRENFNVIAVDIWGSREVTDFQGNTLTESEYAEFEGTNFTPALLFYTEEGEEVLRLRGYYPPYKFLAALEYVAEEYYKTESFRDYLSRADPPGKFEIGDLNSQDFFDTPPYALDRRYFPANMPLVVFFEKENCHACDILHTEPLEDGKSRQLLKNYQAVQVDMMSSQPVLTPDGKKISVKEWAKQLNIFYAPTLVFFDENGKEIIRIDSVVRLYRLRGVLEYVSSKGYLEAPTFQRWRENNQNQQ